MADLPSKMTEVVKLWLGKDLRKAADIVDCCTELIGKIRLGANDPTAGHKADTSVELAREVANKRADVRREVENEIKDSTKEVAKDDKKESAKKNESAE